MKTLFKIINAFLFLNSVTPAFLNYVQDEDPNGGYLAESLGPYKNRMNDHKKYFIGSNNQKYMKLVNERADNSHFTVRKTPTKMFSNDNQKYMESTKVPNCVKSKQKITSKHEEYELSSSTKALMDDIYQDREKTTPVIRSTKQAGNFNEYFQKSKNMHEKKPTFVAINEHRAQVSKDQKVVSVKNNNPASIHQSQKYQQKMPGTGVKDKILHKASAKLNERLNERNTHLIERNDLSQKKWKVNFKPVENKKRDTSKMQPVVHENQIKSHVITENTRKFKNKVMKNNGEKKGDARFKNLEEGNNTTHYALFYRMNPEHLEDQEVMNESEIEEPASTYSEKVSWNYDLQQQSKTREPRTANKVKLNKFIKNHTNYRQS